MENKERLYCIHHNKAGFLGLFRDSKRNIHFYHGDDFYAIPSDALKGYIAILELLVDDLITVKQFWKSINNIYHSKF